MASHSEHVEFEEWFFDYSNSNSIRLAKAKVALERLSARDFADEKLINLATDRYIEADLIKKVAWLSGTDIARLKESIEVRRDDDQDDWRGGDQRKREPLTSLEICAGAGGQAIGLHAAGFRPLSVFEMDKHATTTLKKNFTFGPLFTRDIKGFNFDRYRDHVDLIAGGVPCQSKLTTLCIGRMRDGRSHLAAPPRLPAWLEPGRRFTCKRRFRK